MPEKKDLDYWIDGLVDCLADRIEERFRKNPPKRLLSRKEAAEYLGCSPSQIANLVEAGRLKADTSTGKPRFDIRELDRFIEGSKS